VQPYDNRDFTQFLTQGQTIGPAIQANGQGLAGFHTPASLAISVDTLVAGVHFPEPTSATRIAHKSLAVNLSDLAAMGARPAWYTLGLVLPAWDETWLNEFREGLQALGNAHEITLMACDVVAGPLSITIEVYGLLAQDKPVLKRSTARVGDRIFVSGTLGDAACALEYVLAGKSLPEPSREYLLQRLHCPDPRIALGRALQGVANAVIDISDGFVADLGHILAQSEKGARVAIESLPCSEALLHSNDPDRVLDHVLGGGDDYELCFTVPVENLQTLRERCSDVGVSVHEVGEIVSTPGLVLLREGEPYPWTGQGYEHFRSGRPEA